MAAMRHRIVLLVMLPGDGRVHSSSLTSQEPIRTPANRGDITWLTLHPAVQTRDSKAVRRPRDLFTPNRSHDLQQFRRGGEFLDRGGKVTVRSRDSGDQRTHRGEHPAEVEGVQ